MGLARHCLGCRRFTRTGSYCPACQAQRDAARGTTTQRGLGHDHQLLRRQVLSEEFVCWICGKPAQRGDPLTADHLVSRARGGDNMRSNYRAAHLSCNSRRGARAYEGWAEEAGAAWLHASRNRSR
jgi:5-methylcytosine-specific restriction protein A